jgi:hypothetical protein
MEIGSPDCHILYQNLRICEDDKFALLQYKSPLEAKKFIPLTKFVVALDKQIYDLWSQGKVIKSISFECCGLNDDSLSEIEARVFQKNKKLHNTLEMLSFYGNKSLTKDAQNVIHNFLNPENYSGLLYLGLTQTGFSDHILKNNESIPDKTILGEPRFLKSEKDQHTCISDDYIDFCVKFYQYKEKIEVTPVIINNSGNEDLTENIENIIYDIFSNSDTKYTIGVMLSSVNLDNSQLNNMIANFWMEFLKEEGVTLEQKVKAVSNLVLFSTKKNTGEDFETQLEIFNLQSTFMNFAKEKMVEIHEVLKNNPSVSHIFLLKELGEILISLSDRYDQTYKELAKSVFDSILNSSFSIDSDQAEAKNILLTLNSR